MDLQSSLNKIADALRVPLVYENGKVSIPTKGGNLSFNLLPGLDVQVQLVSGKLFANDAVGIVFHAIGELYLVVSHMATSGAVNLFLIDGSKVENHGQLTPPQIMVGSTMTIREVVTCLRPAIAASFLWKDRKWNVLKLPA